MVTDDDDLVGNGAIDDTDDIPQRSRHILLVIVKVDNHMLRGRTNVVVDAFVSQTKVAIPVLVEVLGLGPMTVEGFQNG